MFGRMGARGGFSGMGAGGDGSWVLPGASLDLDFVRGRGWAAGTGGKAASQFLTTTRASDAYAPNAAGVYSLFSSNVPRITDLGLLVEGSQTNLFLNSGAPATQSVTVVNGTVYTVSVIGTGSVTLSGAGTGTVSQGSPVTFTASSTSLTVTTAGITGDFVNVNVEAGSLATSPIRTTGSAATRSADTITAALAGTAEGSVIVHARTAPGVPASGSQHLWTWELDSSNRILIYRSTSRALFCRVDTAGSTVASLNAGTVADDTEFKIGLSWRADDFVAVLNGGTPATDGSGGAPAGLTTLYHGRSTFPWNGRILRETIFPASRSGSQLQLDTAA